MTDYETEATVWALHNQVGRLNSPNRPEGRGWQLIHIVETSEDGIIGYWQRELEAEVAP